MSNSTSMNYLAKRLNHDHGSIMYDEKFETWLNLNPLIKLKEAVSNIDQWPMTPIFSGNVQLIGYRSLQGFRDAKIRPSLIANAKITPLLPALLIRSILFKEISSGFSDLKKVRDMIKMSAEASLLSINTQVHHLLSSVKGVGEVWTKNNQYVWDLKLNNLPKEFEIAYYCYEQVLKLINEHKALSGMARTDARYISYKRIKLDSLKSTVIITPDLIIWTIKNTNILLSRSCFLEVFNKISELQAVLLYTWLQNGTSMNEKHYDNSLRFWRHISLEVTKWYTEVLPVHLEHENKGFAYIKSIEGLGVSELIRKGDLEWNWLNDTLGQTLWQALFDDGIVSQPNFLVSPLRQILETCPVETLAEIIGTVKIMGHPSIEIEAGLESLYEKTHKNLPINEKTRDACIGILTRDVIRVFFNKFNRYPNLNISKDAHKNLKQFFNRKVPMNSAEGQRLLTPLEAYHWSKVHFGKNDQFERMDNRLSLLKDKALGLTRSKVMINWLTTQGLKRNIIDSKALLHFLFGECDIMELKEYFDKFELDEWDSTLMDYLVIKLTAKELELKAKGRFFGASPALERDRRIVMEANVMRFMHKLIPDQLLTPNELEIIKKLISFRDYRHLYPGCKIINISFDFSSWNNSMRRDVVDVGAGRILDPWFGTRYYDKTMKAYENMLVYYDDGLIKKKWEGQLGGIEGLNQATWSIVFIGGIKYALERLGFKYSITVKGDDVRAAIIVPNSVIETEGYESFRNGILTSIQKLCKDMGWSLNPNESFVSLSLIATSKQYLFNATWLPSSMKKIMKLNSHTNGIFVSLEDIVATIFSIAHSACSQTTVVMPAFVTASFIASTVLYRQLPHHIRSPQAICAMLIWPQILAGPGPLPLQTFFVRGENDMLSAIMSLYQHILVRGSDRTLQGYVRSILTIPMSSPVNHKMILGDPYCIDLKAPDRPESILKRQVRLILEKRVKQPDIKALLSLQMKQQSETIIQILRSIQPYHAKVATALWEATPFYLLEELISKFTHSSTITGFLTQMRTLNSMSRLGNRLWKRVILASQKRWEFWESRLIPVYVHDDVVFSVPITNWLNTCPTSVANRIRCAQWGEVKGITYPSLITQNIIIPELQMNTTEFPFGHVNMGTYSTIQIHTDTCTFETPSQSHHYATSANTKVWLGSTTSQKVEYVDIPEATQSPVLRKLKLLIALRKSAGSLGDSIIPFLDRLIGGYTSVPMTDLELLTPLNTISHFAHRVPINSFSMNTMPNARPNISQLVTVDNETNERLREDTVNRSVNIAARQFMIIALVMFPLQYMQNLPPNHPLSFVSILHYDEAIRTHYEFCPHCCADVDDEIINFPPSNSLDLTSLRGKPLLSCGEFETQALLQAIDNVKLHNHHMNLIKTVSLENDINKVLISLRLIVSNHIHTSIETQFLIKSEQISIDFSYPEAIDNVLMSEGKKPISQSLVSLNVWRSVSSNMLYESMVIEGYNVYLTHIVPHVDNLSSDVVTSILPDVVHTAFSLLMTRLIQVSGLSFINDGLRHKRWVDHEIPWGFHLDKVNELSYMFLKHHWHLYYRWYTDPGTCPHHSSIMLYSNDTLLTQQLQARSNYVLNAYFHALRKGKNVTWPMIRAMIDQLYNRQEWLVTFNECQTLITQTIALCLLTELCLDNDWTDHEHIRESITAGNGTIQFLTWDDTKDVEYVDALLAGVDDVELTEFPYFLSETICYTNIRTKFSETDEVRERSLNYLFLLATRMIRVHGVDFDMQAQDLLYNFNMKYKMIACVQIHVGSFIECERVVKEYATTQEISIHDAPIVSRLPSHMRMRDISHIAEDGPVMFLCKLPHPIGGYMKMLEENRTHPDRNFAKNIWDFANVVQHRLNHNRVQACVDGVDYFRIFGNMNKAYLRWVQVLSDTKMYWHRILRNGTVVVLGDGGGSVSRHLLNTYENVHIIFCDKKSATGPGSRMNAMEFPTEFLNNTDVTLTNRLYSKGFVTGDVTHPSTRGHILTIKKQLKRSCRLIISDIVPDDLNIDTDKFLAIIYGILSVGFEVGDDGAITLLRIPLLQKIDWGLILIQLLQGFAHVHIFTSHFDRPEFVSLYLMIVKHEHIDSFRPDLSRQFLKPLNELGLNMWTHSQLRVALQWIINNKTPELFDRYQDSKRLLVSDWHILLENEPICPINNLFIDWTSEITITESHFCQMWNGVKDRLTQRQEILFGLVTKPLKYGSSHSMTVVNMIIEMCIINAFTSIIDLVDRQLTIHPNAIQSLPGYSIDMITLLQNQCRFPVEILEYLHSPFFVNYKLKIHTISHILRYLSWMALQFRMREMSTDPSHPWMSDDMEGRLCWTCQMIGDCLPSCTAWNMMSRYTINDVLYPRDPNIMF